MPVDDRAEEIVDTLDKMIGGPIATRADALRFVGTALREAVAAERERLIAIAAEMSGSHTFAEQFRERAEATKE